MGARLERLWSQLAAFFLAQPPARRVAIGAVGLVSMAAVLGLAWWAQRPLYRPLFTNLAERDASAIVQALKAEKVPFELEDGGRAVLVPSERQYEMRLALASRGLPEGGGVGFEIFDKQTLGQTDFLQRLNYQRALQGELGRTIGQLGGVEAARVHLALPERSLFVAEDRRPSASVVVKLVQGRTLSAAQIDGIVHLVAASVEGLQPEGVTVVDEAGRILTSDRRGAEATGTSSVPLEIQQTVERGAEERIESMLGAVVGRDKVVARVAANLDFARVERTEEIDRLRELVKSAVGFSEGRGDKIEITSVPFQSEALPAGEGVVGSLGRWAPVLVTRILGVVFAAAMLLWVVRPVVLGIATRLPAGPGGRGALAGMDGAVAQLTQENLALTQQHPERAAQLVREWLRDGGAEV